MKKNIEHIYIYIIVGCNNKLMILLIEKLKINYFLRVK